MDLFVDLSPGLGRQDALEAALRNAISAGRLTPGAPLPSSRALSAQLGLARGTVVAAVEQLAVEGLLETRQGALTRVAHVPPPVAAGPAPRSSCEPPLADFSGGEPDLTRFPRAWWAAAVRKSLVHADASTLGYGDPRGSTALRAALVEYLGRTRGVTAAVENVMVLSGFRQALAMLSRLMHSRGHQRIAVEEPALRVHVELLRAGGLDCAPIPVDVDGARVSAIAAHDVRVVQVTPNHHLPLGSSLSPARRSELAAWAASVNGLVIEDDFDGELRYDRRPLRALQALDPGRIAYCGTASKSVVPGLRLGWCVLPPVGGPTVSTLDQLAFAELIVSGRYDRHVRTVRTEYRRRRDLLSSALTARVSDVQLEGVSAGLVGLIRLPAGCDEDRVVARLAERSVAVMPLGTFYSPDARRDGLSADPELRPLDGPAIVVNYGRPFGHQIAAAIDLLTSALADAIRH